MSEYAGYSGNEIFQSLALAKDVEEFQRAAEALSTRRSVSKTELFEPVFARLIDLVQSRADQRLRDVVTAIVSIMQDEEGISGESWVWPDPDPVLGTGAAGESPIFTHSESLLTVSGYSVGQKADLSEDERRDILVAVLEASLPRELDELFDYEYGEPNSMQRLLKIANVLAANCKNFKRRSNSESYETAINRYEKDLIFLKERFYERWRAGQSALPWPDTVV